MIPTIEPSIMTAMKRFEAAIDDFVRLASGTRVGARWLVLDDAEAPIRVSDLEFDGPRKKSGMVWVVGRGVWQREDGVRLVTLRETFSELLDICRQVRTRGQAAMLGAIKRKALAITRSDARMMVTIWKERGLDGIPKTDEDLWERAKQRSRVRLGELYAGRLEDWSRRRAERARTLQDSRSETTVRNLRSTASDEAKV